VGGGCDLVQAGQAAGLGRPSWQKPALQAAGWAAWCAHGAALRPTHSEPSSAPALPRPTGRRFTGLRPLVRGCMFDSCPCYMHKHSGAHALAHGFPLPLRPLVRGLFHLLVLASFALQGDYPRQFW
jgi:hypothetical protein